MRGTLRFRTVRQHPALLAGGILLFGLAAAIAIPRHKISPSILEPTHHASSIVVAAARSLPAGTTIEARDIKLIAVTGAAAPGAMFSYSDALGHVTTMTYAAGAVLSHSGLNEIAALGIVAHVLPGQRAFSIRVAEDDIVGGFLQSGDHVDIFATIPGSVFSNKTVGDSPDQSQTVLLLQNLLVLAVGSNPATRGSVQTDARTVSLSLTPAALAKLALAQRFGKVSLAIRKPGDASNPSGVSATLADLVPLAATAAPVDRSAPPRTSTARRSEIPFYLGTRVTSISRGWQ
jgi:pilus assembly protein CpaB